MIQKGIQREVIEQLVYAQKSIQKEDYLRALDIYKSLINYESISTDIFLRISTYYWVIDQYNESEKYLKIALEKGGENQNTLAFMYDFYLYGLVNYPKAIDALKKGLELNPYNLDFLNSACYSLISEDLEFGIEDAVTIMERSVKIDGLNSSNCFTLGSSYYKLKEFEKGKEYIQKALLGSKVADSLYTEQWTNLFSNSLITSHSTNTIIKSGVVKPLITAHNFRWLKDFDKALEIYLDLSRKYHGISDIFAAISNCYFNISLKTRSVDFSKALFFLEKAIELSPHDTSLYWQYGEIFRLGIHDYVNAAEMYKSGLRLNELEINLFHALALLYEINDSVISLEEAIYYFEKIHQLNGKESDALLYLGILYHRKGNIVKSKETFLKSLLSGNGLQINPEIVLDFLPLWD